MGYTHYFTQRRNLTLAEWTQVTEDVGAILKFVEFEQGIALAGSAGEGNTRPEFTADSIMFNGLGEDAHETLVITRKRTPAQYPGDVPGGDFCKTARKPYDLAVTACLAYLTTVLEGAFTASSDGRGADWLAGVEAVRKATPKWGNVVDIPMDVMKDGRWVGPWITNRSPSYSMHFCVDGKAYVIREKDQVAVVFETHRAAALWAKPSWKETLNPMGSFDWARWARIRRAQTKLFKELFFSAEMFNPGSLGRAPAYVRPDQFPALPHTAYYLDDVLKLQEV